MQPLVLVLGCGKSGLKLARYYASGKMRVIGVDRDIDSANARRFRNHGFDTLEVDLADGAGIGALAWTSAERVVICTGDDFTDLNLCRSLLKQHSRSRHGSKVIITLETPGVSRLVEFDPLLADKTAEMLSFLDLTRFSARLLFQAKPPHAFRSVHRRFVAGAENPCHVALMMSPAHIESYVLQAVRALVYCPQRPLRVSLFVENADEWDKRLRSRYPALYAPAEEGADDIFGGQTPLAHVETFESSVTQINVRVLRSAHRAQPIDVIYAIGADDTETALLLAESIKGADVLAEPKPAVVAGFAADQGDRLGAMAHIFDESSSTDLRVERFALHAWLERPPATAGDTPQGFNDELAHRVHDDYCARHGGKPWSHLSDHERWFNRHTADHALIKLALVRAAARCAAGNFDGALREHLPWLARLEHRRYVCERMVDGWIRRITLDPVGSVHAAAGRHKLNRYHLNPTLLPFDQLPEAERVKDEEIARVLNIARSSADGIRITTASEDRKRKQETSAVG